MNRVKVPDSPATVTVRPWKMTIFYVDGKLFTFIQTHISDSAASYGLRPDYRRPAARQRIGHP